MPLVSLAEQALPLAQSPSDGGDQQICDPEGEMFWSQSGDQGSQEHHHLCYGPSLRQGRLGPSLGRDQCDVGSYFMVEAPRFCARNARIDVRGTQVKAKGQVCGDLLAEFEPESQRLRLVRGPAVTGSAAQLDQLRASRWRVGAPSPLALEAMKEAGDWKPALNAKCRGFLGTLLKWTHSKPAGRAELCKPGTPPVQGPGYASWETDGFSTEEHRLHCCTVQGQLRCVKRLSAARPTELCKCPGIGGPDAFL